MDATDGVIKFASERHAGTVPWGPQLEVLNHARTTLFDLGLIGAYPNGVGYGNLSLRVSGDQGNQDNQFVITGSATGAQRILQASQYCLVEAFSIEHNWVRTRGAIDASSESMTHGAVYAANPAIHCVIHVHSRVLFDTLLHQKHRDHPATPATIPYGTPAMAQAVCTLVQQPVALPLLFVMAGHDEGIIACGMDVDSVQNLLLATTKRICTP